MPINQGFILQKIRQYLADEKRSSKVVASFFDKNGNPKGLCQGFSNLWEMDSRWFFSVLAKLENYGKTELSPADKIEIETFISILRFYQSPESYIAAGQGQLDKIDAVILGEQGLIRVPAGKAVLTQKNATAVGIYKNLQELFSKGKTISITFEAKILNPRDGKEEFQTHQVAAKINEDGSYSYYDSNNKMGEKVFSGKMALLKMAEEMANWNVNMSRQDFRIGLIAFNKIPLAQASIKDSKDEVIHNLHSSSKDVDLALTMAVRIDDIPMIKTLLDDGANPNFKNGLKETPLFLAARSGHADSVRCLLEKSDINNVATALIGAAGYGQRETSQLLVNKLREFKEDEPTINRYMGMALISAAKHDHTHVMKELLEFKIPKDFLDEALRAAIISGSLLSQHFLIDHGANLHEIHKSTGMTLLDEAFTNSNLETITRLLSLGADPNRDDQAERLFESIQLIEDSDSQAEIRRLLILSGARIPVELQPLAIQTALMAGRPDILAGILEDGANPDLASVRTMTPLIIAIGKLDLTAIDLLLEAGADPRKVAPEGKGNGLVCVERMLAAAQSAGNTDKLEKLASIQIKLNEHLQKEVGLPKEKDKVMVKEVRPSMITPYTLLTSCRSGGSSQEVPTVEISQSASLS